MQGLELVIDEYESPKRGKATKFKQLDVYESEDLFNAWSSSELAYWKLQIDIHETAFFICDFSKKVFVRKFCASNEFFINGECVNTHKSRYKRQGVSGSGRVGDYCSFNTDCLTGMFCSTGVCTCLSNFVAIQGYCYLS
uniref:EB domain-containing protein n=1 Tax=Ditylenchus dipsaci TaxID=166011 RepID=A0A915DMK5_9BILA